MTKKVIHFSTASTTYYFDASFDYLEKLVPRDNTFIITDENKSSMIRSEPLSSFQRTVLLRQLHIFPSAYPVLLFIGNILQPQRALQGIGASRCNLLTFSLNL